MSAGIVRRLMEVYMTNGIDEASANQFAREFMFALNAQPVGTVWVVRGADNKKVSIRKN